MPARFYYLYGTFRGPSPHWQYRGKARVRGCERDSDGTLWPPVPNWKVRAVSAEQACYFVRHSITSAKHGDDLGVWSWPKHEAAQRNDGAA
jgi:hypothetical protein